MILSCLETDDVNVQTEDGVTPLMRAVILNQNPEVIKVLLEAGADLNVRGKHGLTPLMWAAEWEQNPEVIKLLVRLQADVNVLRNKDSMTLLIFLAAQCNQNLKL